MVLGSALGLSVTPLFATSSNDVHILNIVWFVPLTLTFVMAVVVFVYHGKGGNLYAIVSLKTQTCSSYFHIHFSYESLHNLLKKESYKMYGIATQPPTLTSKSKELFANEPRMPYLEK